MGAVKKYRVCIVGVTGIGSGRPLVDGHAGYGAVVPHSYAAAYSVLAETEIVGVCDLQQDRLDQFKEVWSMSLPSLKYYIDCRQMIVELEPDILSVVTSDDRHADIVVFAAQSGVQGMLRKTDCNHACGCQPNDRSRGTKRSSDDN